MPGPGVLWIRRGGRQAQQQQRERIWHQRLTGERDGNIEKEER